MARASYQAPGVYVEEVPSAQQPISGVGTNTVGFIGLVPKEIQYPVPNPDYDPVQAQLALSIAPPQTIGAGAPRDATAEFERQKAIAAAEFDRQILQLGRENTRLGTTPPGAITGQPQALALANQQRIIDNQDRIRQNNEKLTELQAAREGRITPLKPGQSSVLRPYLLETFPVKVDAYDTKLCTNFTEYTSRFGPFPADEPDIPDSERQKYLRGRALAHAVNGFFRNGGTRCFVARVDSDNPAEIERALEAFESIEEVAIIAAPGLYGQEIWDALIAHCEKCENRFAILEGPEVVGLEEEPRPTVSQPGRSLSGGVDAPQPPAGQPPAGQPPAGQPPAGQPPAGQPPAGQPPAGQPAAAPPAAAPPAAASPAEPELDITLLNYDNPDHQRFLPPRSKNAAYYFPYIEVADPAKRLQDEDPYRGVDLKYRGRVYVSPSGHIAGIYARTDEDRGVHKAPANSTVIGALDVKYYIGRAKQELLNPQGVNCIRSMNGNITVWGARTIGGDKNGEWKYINVRRFFLFMRKSIDEGTQWVVFEPNDPALWGKIRRNLSAFLTNVWRSGALFGLTPEEAFYVKCDAETNPPEVRDLGQVVTEIGVAIVRPAEFVIFRITQATGPRRS